MSVIVICNRVGGYLTSYLTFEKSLTLQHRQMYYISYSYHSVYF